MVSVGGVWAVCLAQVFDEYAPNFDAHLTGELRYGIPGELFKALTDATEIEGGAGRYGTVVDAGCGTGLSGEPFRPICRHLVGVDISAGMLDEARKKDIYDELLNMDLVAGLDAQVADYASPQVEVSSGGGIN